MVAGVRARRRCQPSLRRTVAEVRCVFVRRGLGRVAAAMVRFAGHAGHRSYLVVYRTARANVDSSTPVARLAAGDVRRPHFPPAASGDNHPDPGAPEDKWA